VTNIQLSLALWPNRRVESIFDGSARPEGIDLVISKVSPPDTFWRQLKFAEFDVSEMSLSSLVMLTSRGDSMWKALPVFPDRRFFHLYALVRADSQIIEPQDLKGRAVAVPEYQQTAALWTRGILEHDFGVRPSDMKWYMERTAQWSHGGALGFTPPPSLGLTHIPTTSSMVSMLREGALDALLVYTPALIGHAANTAIDRSHEPLDSLVRPLFPSKVDEARRALVTLGFVPMNHCIVIRTSLLDRDPWLAQNLFDSFRFSAEIASERLQADIRELETLGLVDEGVEALVETAHPFHYGVRSNREALAALCQLSFEQGLSGRLVRPEEFLAPTLLET